MPVVPVAIMGWRLRIVLLRQRAFKVTGLAWIVERSFACLRRNPCFSKDHEFKVQSSETMIDVAATRLMLNRIAPLKDLLDALSMLPVPKESMQ